MGEQHLPVVVVGGGQAGLSVSYYLTQQGIEHAVLEKNQIGHSWRSERWDSFCLVTPNWQCQLPGYSYLGQAPEGFMLKHEIVQYVADYAASFGAPVREGVSVQRLSQERQGFRLQTSDGTWRAEQVVVATGAYHKAVVPAYATQFPQHVAQLHSSQYRNPGQLPPGEVLVVGSGQSGCQIAEDLHLAGRRVHLCVGNAPRCARVYRGKDVVAWLDQMGYYDIPIERHPNREQVRDKTNHYVTGRDGGRDIDLRVFAQQGMQLYGPCTGYDAHGLQLAPTLRKHLDEADQVYNKINAQIDEYIGKAGIDAPPASRYQPVWEPAAERTCLPLTESGISSVVWCIGFSADFSWLDVPVLDARGFPIHERGVSKVAGLYFVGLPWLYTWGSGRFSGVGRDALHIVQRLTQSLSEPEPAAQQLPTLAAV